MFEIFVAFAASFAFALKFDVNKKELLYCGISGMVSESVFLAAFGNEKAFAIFLASVSATVLSRMLANIRKVPVTVYLLSGVLPLVPGSGMYNTVFNIISSDYESAMLLGFDTVKSAVAIAIGIILVFALPNKLFLKRG